MCLHVKQTKNIKQNKNKKPQLDPNRIFLWQTELNQRHHTARHVLYSPYAPVKTSSTMDLELRVQFFVNILPGSHALTKNSCALYLTILMHLVLATVLSNVLARLCSCTTYSSGLLGYGARSIRSALTSSSAICFVVCCPPVF